MNFEVQELHVVFRIDPKPEPPTGDRVAVTAIADASRRLAFDSGRGIDPMRTGKPMRPDRAELVSRGMALAALLAGVVWAWLDAGAGLAGS